VLVDEARRCFFVRLSQHTTEAADSVRATAGNKHSVLLQTPQQPRRAEYLPPDWAILKARDGTRTFLGPSGQRLRSVALLAIPTMYLR
jgi:hypothetical protein